MDQPARSEAIPSKGLDQQFQSILQNTFKLNSFRPGQYEALLTLFTQGRLLCIQPTGHGKSLLYQLPSVLLTGITIVLSPLLALMRDQIQQLNQRFHIPAASINSDQSDEENYQAQTNTLNGSIKILFIAPEKLDQPFCFNFLLELPVSMVVIDEAHCVSTWGHDFRPSYRQILHFIYQMEQKSEEIKILAITATANQQIEHDIIQQLSHSGKKVPVLRQSMNRPNLQLETITAHSITEKLLYLKQLLQQLDGHGLIYCSTRENTEMVSNFLQANSIKTTHYHAGMDAEAKKKLQHDFMTNQYQAIVATNALGMGIDKADLRYIIHFDMPGSITAYYQEVGRAGRDGQLARGLLLFDEKDKKIQQYFIASAQPKMTDFYGVMDTIKFSERPLSLIDIKCKTGLHPTRVAIVVAELFEQGYLEKKVVDSRQVYIKSNKSGHIDLSRYERQLEVRERELNEILNYGSGKTKQCLMAVLRKSLGDLEVESCGQCTHCTSSQLNFSQDYQEMLAIDQWLLNQITKIDLGKFNSCERGVAILDSKLRSPLFMEFMQNRQVEGEVINPQLCSLLKNHLLSLHQQFSFIAIIVLPSETWCQRAAFAKWLEHELSIPVYLDVLTWKNKVLRQGECLNNDQRRANVTQQMVANFKYRQLTGPILLLDDYLGSGATLKEAARVLRKNVGIKTKIVPFTIAAVKWRLGQRGMI